jgi:hypothetical protein
MEQAKLIDKAKSLNALFLDAQLVTAIKRGAAKGDTRAIQMGYQRLGMMRDGEFLDVLSPEPALATKPVILTRHGARHKANVERGAHLASVDTAGGRTQCSDPRGQAEQIREIPTRTKRQEGEESFRRDMGGAEMAIDRS